MGRVKLKIKRLENTNGRQATFSKRKNGLIKKANELSILCDIDIVLLMFSPTGRPCIYNGKHSIEEVIAKYAQLSPEERAKRKLESLEALKKTFKKLDHDVNVQELLGAGDQTIEDLTNLAKSLQTQLSEVQIRLSNWANPENINSVEHLEHMEETIRKSLNQVQAYKEDCRKQQLTSLECTSEVNICSTGLMLPFEMGAEPQLQPLSWLPGNDNQTMVLTNDSNMLSQRGMKSPAGLSFGSYSGYFGTTTKAETANPGQESGVLNELDETASLSLQLGGQYPYQSYFLNLLSDKLFEPEMGMNLQNPRFYHANGSFELPGYGTTQGWASTSEPCPVAMIDKHSYPQQPN